MNPALPFGEAERRLQSAWKALHLDLPTGAGAFYPYLVSKGIHTRGYLSHWDFSGSVQAITFRLADSVPSSVLAEWRVELASINCEQARQKALHQRITRYEDAGHGEAILGRSDCAEVVQLRLMAGHGADYKLIDWCIMPNHVHVLFKLEGNATIPVIVKGWKGASAIGINRLLGRKGTLWQRDYYDRLVRDMEHFHDCRFYIRNNPVKAGLCAKPEDWRFSSAGCGWGEAG